MRTSGSNAPNRPRSKRKPRKAFSEMNIGRIGIVGLVATVLLLAVALNIGKVIALVQHSTYTADFAEAGGLRSGDDVRVDGLKVGKVNKVELDGNQVKVTFGLSGVDVGDQSRAEVKSNNALGSKFLAIDPEGSGNVRHIPLARTDAGISINDELGRLTTDTSKIDSQNLARSFRSISSVLSQTPRQFRAALTGVSALSRTISSRDSDLQTLLHRASGVSSVLANRNRQITGILSDGGNLFQELQARRIVIAQLLHNVQTASRQLTGLAKDNRNSLGPALRQLKRAGGLLKHYRSTLDYGLKNFGVYARALGESVGSGPFFQAYIGNIGSPEDLVTGGIAGLVTDSLGGTK